MAKPIRTRTESFPDEPFDLTTRREFLKGATAVAAGLVVASPGEAAETGTLPAVPLGKHRVSRLIIGGNPVYGYSHFNRILDQEMREWYTDERIVEVMLACEKAGINTWQANFDHVMDRQFPKLRAAGCRIQWVCLAASWHYDPKWPRTPEKVVEGTIKCAEAAMRHQPIGIAFHGWATDMLYRAGKLDMIKPFIDRVHELGTAAAISTHNPVILAALEEKGWNNDFYMASLYYQTRRPEEFQKEFGLTPVGETYVSTDPERMLEAVRKVKKPCLVYKLLAAGRRCNSRQEVRQAFEFAYHHMKPSDAAIVGMYPRYSDQISENSAMVREILA